MSSFETRWLAETICRHEHQHGREDDEAANAAARQAAPDLELRIRQRAVMLAQRHGWPQTIRRWRQNFQFVLTVAAVLVCIAGFAGAAAVLGDGSRPVNIIWTLGSLLGVNLLSLLLWLLLMLWPAGGSGAGLSASGLPGRLWFRLMTLMERSPASGELMAALGSLLGRSPAPRWAVGTLSHLLWALALSAAVLGLLAMLTLRRYDFVWETTILPTSVFVTLADLLGWLPALLGFTVPDPATVIASGDQVMSAASGRRAWSSWLLGVLLLYGVLPRIVLALLCAWLGRRSLHRLRLDLSRPAYVRLRPLLLPESERIGIRDPAPAASTRSRQGRVPNESPGHQPALLALELGADLAWPPQAPLEGGEDAPTGASHLAEVDGGRIDSREQRHAVRQRFAAHPPSRLLVAVDVRRAPDRGHVAILHELRAHVADLRLWAYMPAGMVPEAGRLQQWRERLAELGLAADALITDAALADLWLRQDEEER